MNFRVILIFTVSKNFERSHEALLIKKFKPKLNRQLYDNGCSFLLKVF